LDSFHEAPRKAAGGAIKTDAFDEGFHRLFHTFFFSQKSPVRAYFRIVILSTL